MPRIRIRIHRRFVIVVVFVAVVIVSRFRKYGSAPTRELAQRAMLIPRVVIRRTSIFVGVVVRVARRGVVVIIRAGSCVVTVIVVVVVVVAAAVTVR